MKEITQELCEEETTRRRDAALLRALSTPHKRQKEMKVGKRQPIAMSERDILAREGIAWLDFLRSVPLGEEGGSSMARKVILFGQSLRDLSHQDSNVGGLDEAPSGPPVLFGSASSIASRMRWQRNHAVL